MGESGVAEVYQRDPIGFKHVVDSEGTQEDYVRQTGFSEGAVRKYYFASQELNAHGATTSVAEGLLETNKQLRRENKRLRDRWSQVSYALDAYSSVRQYHPPKDHTPNGWEDPELMIASIADTHIGSLVLPEHTGGLEEYSWDVFTKRADTYIDRFATCTDVIRRSVPMDTCYVLLLGDMVEGEGIFPLQHSQLDALGIEQIFEGAAVIGNIIESISRQYKRVVVFGIPGNHGRQKDSTINLDVIFYAFLKKDLAPLENVTIHISSSHFLLFYIGPELGILDYEEKGGSSWIYGALHGNTVRSWMGVPAYGLNRAVWRYQSATDVHIYKLICGHHHEEATGNKWILCPSWVAGSDYSMAKMQGCTQPMQLLLTHHARLGLTSMRHIYLSERPSLQGRQDENGILTPLVEAV